MTPIHLLPFATSRAKPLYQAKQYVTFLYMDIYYYRGNFLNRRQALNNSAKCLVKIAITGFLSLFDRCKMYYDINKTIAQITHMLRYQQCRIKL